MASLSDGPVAARVRTAALKWLDAVWYAAVLTAVAFVGAAVAGIATGGGLVRAKVLLFLGGFLLMGYATVLLWPSSPDDLATGESIPAGAERTPFESLARTLPPVRWLPAPPPGERMSLGGKLFVGSLFVLLVSYLMETVFGVV